METQSSFVELKNQLKETSDSISSIFKNKPEKIKTDEIKFRFIHFIDTEVEKIKLEVIQAIKVLDSPVYVGLLGRYSHGKTALVNALFSIDPDFCLPEGEGVVTSKITRVEFTGNIVRPKCYEWYRGGEKSPIEITALHNSVSRKPTEDSSVIDYYSMEMPARELFAKMFETKLIHLIDMPGLGGPYFNDTEKTKKYVENLDMLLVVIKISEINLARRVIEDYIASMSKSIPMIPVITFFDKWRESPQFTACTTEEEVLEKVHEQIKDLIPSLARHLTKTILVSTKYGKDGIDNKNSFQIENLRDMILNFVDEQTFAIPTIRQEGTDVFKKKSGKFRELLKAL